MHDAQSCAGEHRHDRLRHHGHVDGDPVAGDQAERGQRVRGLADLVLELGVGQRAGVADWFALPVDRDPLPVARLDVAVHTVVGDVEPATDEPLGERCLRPIQDFAERGVPGEPAGLFGPEFEPVGLRPAIQVRPGVGSCGEPGRRGVMGLSVGRFGHGRERSHHARSRCGVVTFSAGRCFPSDERLPPLRTRGGATLA